MFKNLLPYPAELRINPNTFFLSQMAICEYRGNKTVPEMIYRRFDELTELIYSDKDEEAPLLFFPGENKIYDEAGFLLYLGKAFMNGDSRPDVELPNNPQAYGITVTPEDIYIYANTEIGIFYGMTTLIQMLTETIRSGSPMLPCCEITDYPAIPIRGHFDDISRKRISSTDDFKLILSELGRYKINYYGMYIEDVLHINAFPDIGRTRGKLMPAEVKELITEGEANGVNIIPFFQLIGHCENLLSMPNYEHLGKKVNQRMSSLDPANPEVRDFLSICIKEVCELFPCEYFGMGFDETQGVTAEDYIDHANWCAAELAKHNKKALLWADMFYKTYGMDKLTGLNENIILVNWQYDGIDEISHHAEFTAYKRELWGFGGYSTWCRYLPNTLRVKQHMDCWSSLISRGPDNANSALFYSQWGDNGYENNRDLPWNLFIYAGETSWRGDNKYSASFDDRFIINMFGTELPALKSLYCLPSDKFNFSSSFYWQLHRQNADACMRICRNSRERAKYIEDHDLLKKIIDELKREYEWDFPANIKNLHGGMIYRHFIIYTELQLMNIKKMLLSFKLAEKFDKSTLSLIPEFTSLIIDCREKYIADWLINNRREGLEVSVKVFDEVTASFQELSTAKCTSRKGFHPIDLSAEYNEYMDDIAGIPVGNTVVSGIPFKFADLDKTFIRLGSTKKEISLPVTDEIIRVQNAKISDLYLIAASPMQPDLGKYPLLQIEWHKNNSCIRTDILNSTEHICDWWAPAGEHIWAGGGYEYIDSDRVTPALTPNDYYGLAIIDRFPGLSSSPLEADEIKIKAIGDSDVCLFALTVKTTDACRKV